MPRSFEGSPTPDAKTWIASVFLSGLAAVALGIVVDRYSGTRMFFMEDGPVETLQAILLFGIAIVFSLGFLRSAGARALFCLVGAYACLFAVTREIPRCGSAFTGGDLCLTSTWKQTIVLCASALGLLALVLRPIDWRRAVKVSYLRWTWPILVVIGFLAAAEAMESLVYYSEIEEFLELAAYLHLLAMAFGLLRQTARSPSAGR